jgi:hypothetical protein
MHKSCKPKNVTQFCQFLISDNVKKLLKAKGIMIDRNNVIDKARRYKHSMDEKALYRIVESFK